MIPEEGEPHFSASRIASPKTFCTVRFIGGALRAL